MPPQPDPSPAPPRLPAKFEAGPETLSDEDSWDGLEVNGSFAGQEASLLDVTACVLSGAVLTAAELDRLRLADTVFEDCELSGAVLTRLAAHRVEFRRCRMSGLVAAGAEWKDVRFTDCKLNGANFRMTTWARAVFEDCVMTESDFGSAKLTDATFESCDLTSADFSKASLAGTRLHGSTLEGIAGAESLRGVVIGTDQVVPLALSVFSAMRIRIDDDPEGEERR